MKNIYCKSSAFSIGKYFDIIDNDKGKTIGKYEDDYFFYETEGRIDDNKILFKKQSNFSRKYDISKQDDNAYKFHKIGILEFNFWKTNAKITIFDHIYYYKLTNLVNSNYVIYDNKNNNIIEGNCIYTNHNIKVNPLNDFSSAEEERSKLIIDILILSSLKIYKNFYYIFFFFLIVILNYISFIFG